MRDEGRERRGDKRVKCVNVQQEGKARRVFGGCALREGVKNPTAGASGPSGIWHLASGVWTASWPVYGIRTACALRTGIRKVRSEGGSPGVCFGTLGLKKAGVIDSRARFLTV